MDDREHRIRERAHAMWLEEGKPEGEHARHWDAACREIDAQAAASTDGEVAPAQKKSRTRSAAPKTTPAAQSATVAEAATSVAEAPKAKRAAAPKKAANTPARRKPGSAKA